MGPKPIKKETTRNEVKSVFPSTTAPEYQLQRDTVSQTKGSKPGTNTPICTYFGFNGAEPMRTPNSGLQT